MSYIQVYQDINNKIIDHKNQLDKKYEEVYNFEILNMISFSFFKKKIIGKINKIILDIQQISNNLFDYIRQREKLIKKHNNLLNNQHNIIIDDHMSVNIIDPIIENFKLKYDYSIMLNNLKKKYVVQNMDAFSIN